MAAVATVPELILCNGTKAGVAKARVISTFLSAAALGTGVSVIRCGYYDNKLSLDAVVASASAHIPTFCAAATAAMPYALWVIFCTRESQPDDG